MLLAEASAFSRGLIRSGLDMAGYVVLEAENLDEVIARLEQQPVDIILAALDLPPGGISALPAVLTRRPEWETIPIVALLDSPEEAQGAATWTTGFQDCLVKFDRPRLLEAVARLAAARPSPIPQHAGAQR